MMRFFLCFAIQIYICRSLNILQVVPGFSHSHVLFNHRLAHTLTKAGHNVTLLNMIMTPNLAPKPTPEGVVEIRIQPDYSPELARSLVESLHSQVFSVQSFDQMRAMTLAFRDGIALQCKDVLSREDLLEQLKSSNFDIMLSHFFSECPVGLAHILNIKNFVWVSPGPFFLEHVADHLALPNIVSYLPYYIADSSDRMNFVSRMKNLFWVLFSHVLRNVNSVSTFVAENKYFRQFPNEHFPDLWTLAEDTKALLISGEQILDFPRPTYHAMLHMGTLEESKRAKELPQDWQILLDQYKGVILFSLGTVANTSLMPIHMKEAFLSAFSHFPDYLVVWKLEGVMPKGLEDQKHVKIVKWMPQKELLQHPKMKLFITHGGYNSLLETTQAGVPMILMPLFSDQYGNGHRAVRHGLGLMLDKLKIDSKIVTKTIEKVLTDEKFHKHAQAFSSLLQDKIIPNELGTVKLLEQIVRSKHYPTMKSAQRLNFFQYYCLDVLLVLLLINFVCVFVTAKGFALVFRVVKKLQ